MVIVWISLSNSREIILQQQVGEIIILFITGLVIHLFYLTVNFVIFIYFLGNVVPIRQAISIIIMASQKSSPVAISIIIIITKISSQKGLRTIPCLLGHIGQIFVGSWITGYLAGLVSKEDERAAMVAATSQLSEGDHENEETNVEYELVQSDSVTQQSRV